MSAPIAAKAVGALAAQVAARRIINAAQRAGNIGVMASDPVTPGANGANSTVPGQTARANTWNPTAGTSGAQVQMDNPNIEQVAGRYGAKLISNGGFLPETVTQADLVTRAGGISSATRFCYDGQIFGAFVSASSSQDKQCNVRILVTDLETGVKQWTRAADYTVANANQVEIKCDFGSAKPREIVVFTGRALYARGFNFEPGRSFFPAQAAGRIRSAFGMDSFSDGVTYGGEVTTKTQIAQTWAHVAARMLGDDVPLVSGFSGTGWARNVAPKWGDRIDAGDFSQARAGKLDFIGLFGTINDRTENEAAVLTAMDTKLRVLRAQQPNAFISYAGPQWHATSATPQSRYDAMKAVVQGIDSRFIWLDNSPAGEAWQTGNGFLGTSPPAGSTQTIVGSVSGSTATITANIYSRITTGMTLTYGGNTVTIATGGGQGGFTGTFNLTAPGVTAAPGTVFTVNGQTGNGNSDFYANADEVHWSEQGHFYLGQRYANAALRALDAIANS